VVAIHPNMEEGLNKALSNLPQQRKIYVTNDEHDEHSNSSKNYHLWLDIDQMQNFAKRLTDKLIKIDHGNSATYQNNLAQVNQKLEQLKHTTRQQLSKVKLAPIATYSNTFEYFIKSNHLQKSTTITHLHGDRLSIQKILKAKQAMQANQTKCLLSTTEIPAKRIAVLTEGLDINTASIDIMGYRLDKGAAHYFDLMQNISNKVEQCLQ
nr:zinc ABC transporter substrate-binding protein [Gammaproteobacteria bacterium]